MSVEITCPVCSFEHIPQNRETCPQCDSDLVCFKLLDALPDLSAGSTDRQINGLDEFGSGVEKTTKSKTLWPAWVLAGILFILVCLAGYIVHHFSAVETRVQKLDTDMARVKEDLNKNSSQVNHIKKRVEELVEITKDNNIRMASLVLKQETISTLGEEKNDLVVNQDRTEKPCFDIYRAKDEDSLWTIAQKLYGSGILYPVLMENNPDLSIYSIGSKDTIRYMCDKAQAVKVYKAIIDKKQNKVFWKYTVRSGETRKDIIKRYCLNQNDCLVEDKPLETGMTIGVFLE